MHGIFQIVAGAHFLSTDEDGTKQTVKLDELIIHEEYNHNSLGINDICLIKVSTPFTFDDAVAPCTLPEQDEAPEGNQIQIAKNNIKLGFSYQKDAEIMLTITNILIL